MASASLTATADTYLDDVNPTTNSAASEFIITGQSNVAPDNVFKSLIKWDISSVPAGSTISAAAITLNVREEKSDNARTLSVYRVKRAWVEAEATWNIYSSGNNWGTAGCANTTSDREAAAIGTATQPANPSPDDDLVITLDATKIQEWLDGGMTNNGVLLQVATETDDAVFWRSREYGTAADRPKLTLTYTPPGGGPKAMIFF